MWSEQYGLKNTDKVLKLWNDCESGYIHMYIYMYTCYV